MKTTLASFALVPTFVLVMASSGCSDKSSSGGSGGTNTTSSGNPITAPVDYLGAVAKAQKSTTSKLSLVGIQQAIQMYQAQEGRFPKTLDDLVKAQVIGSIPPPPQGMKYSYDPKSGDIKLIAQ